MKRRSFIAVLFAPLLAPFIKKDAVALPFVKEVFIPPSAPIGKLYYLDIIYKPLVPMKELETTILIRKDGTGVPMVEIMKQQEEIARQSWANVRPIE